MHDVAKSISNVPVQSNARPRRRWRSVGIALGLLAAILSLRFRHQGAANPQDDVNADGDAADDSVECRRERRRLGADVVGGRIDFGRARRSQFPLNWAAWWRNRV